MPVDHVTAIADHSRAKARLASSSADPKPDWQRVTDQLSEILAGDTHPADLVAAIQDAAEQLRLADEPMSSKFRQTNQLPGAVDRRRSSTENTQAPRHEFAWSSASAKKLLRQLQRVSAVDATVMLVGESGTGKTTIARMIHQRSSRRDQPFVAVNCASLPRELMDTELFGHSRGAFTGAVEERMGKVESADGGTLFLDEIGDLPIELQPKLLTFLQERTFYRIGSNQLRHVNVRVISATHANLTALAAAQKFRQDLFFRLAVLRVDVPALTAAPRRNTRIGPSHSRSNCA